MSFYIFWALLAAQRCGELVLARSNEEKLKNGGGLEFGTSHYPWMVLMHIGFFVSLAAEYLLLGKEPSAIWQVWLSLFLIAQAGRVWVISSLGEFWNTKIIVVPGAEPVKKGPFRFMKHPNYVIVASEILIIACLFNAYLTAVSFSVLNAMMMRVRIPIEERALSNLTNYRTEQIKKE